MTLGKDMDIKKLATLIDRELERRGKEVVASCDTCGEKVHSAEEAAAHSEVCSGKGERSPS